MASEQSAAAGIAAIVGPSTAANGKRVLVTGGAGFIGSHTVVALVGAGYTVTIVDNLSNSNDRVLARINELTGKPEAVTFHKLDMRDKEGLRAVFAEAPIAGVIHFAAFKAVGESRQKPLMYYDNNLNSTVTLLQVMDEAGVKSLVFSSSCTVYGVQEPPLDENRPMGKPTNAYATTKHMAEAILMDLCSCDPTWAVCILRYFNPVSAHPSGRLGEDPAGTPNCLMPFCLQVLVGRQKQLTVFGTDYPTRDGTCVRDYIHVVDLAEGHISAMDWLDREARKRTDAGLARGFVDVFNLGTGTGTTVLELVTAVEKASGRKLTHVLGPRRDGDLASAYADPAKAATVLGWTAKRGLDEMCRDAWNFQSQNPNGY